MVFQLLSHFLCRYHAFSVNDQPGILLDPRAPSCPRSCIATGEVVIVVVVVVVIVVVVGMVVVGFAQSAEIGRLRILLHEMKRWEPSVA